MCEHFCLFQCGDDKTVKQWSTTFHSKNENPEPINTILGKVCCFGCRMKPKLRSVFVCSDDIDQQTGNFSKGFKDLRRFIFQTVFQSIDHHWKENTFATCGDVVEIWDEQRSEPIR